MRVKFYLKNKNRKNTGIYLKSWYKKGVPPFVMSTGLHIEPRYWDSSLGRARATRAYPPHHQVNALLNDIENDVTIKYLEFVKEEGTQPTHTQLKDIINRDKQQREHFDLLIYIDKVIAERKLQPQKYGERTIKNYITTRNWVEKYHKRHRKSLEFGDITVPWLRDFQQYLFNLDKAHNTVTAVISKLKHFLNEAHRAGYYPVNHHKDPSLSMNYRTSDEIFLTPDELMQLYHLDLAGSTLEKYRDLFLLDAFSGGFRFADLEDLKKENIIPIMSDRMIKLTTSKTGTAVYTPASWYLDEFLAKYKDGFPKVTNQKLNKYIKVVAAEAGITALTPLTKNKAGRNYTATKPKNEWVTQYTARYSFATNLFLNGMRIKKISVLLGHSKVQTTEGYIKASQLETVRSVADNPYFTDKPSKKAG